MIRSSLSQLFQSFLVNVYLTHQNVHHFASVFFFCSIMNVQLLHQLEATGSFTTEYSIGLLLKTCLPQSLTIPTQLEMLPDHWQSNQNPRDTYRYVRASRFCYSLRARSQLDSGPACHSIFSEPSTGSRGSGR